MNYNHIFQTKFSSLGDELSVGFFTDLSVTATGFYLTVTAADPGERISIWGSSKKDEVQ